ncbi:glycosyltransferase family 4 protein [bacterium]|nr:glycosyltransferase family 4 protein [bacterium]
MKVLFLVPYPPQGASNRFRVNQFVPRLEAAGLCCRIRPFYSERLWRILYRRGHVATKLFHVLFCAFNRCLDLFRALGSDLVLIHREAFPVGPAWFERLLRLTGRRYVYDFDDALFLPNVADSNRLFGRLKCPGKVASIVRLSSIVLAGNEYLAEYARRAGACTVHVAPTVVDTGVFRPRETGAERQGPLVIGWIGSPTTVRYLEPLRPLMRSLLARYPGRVEFRVVGASLPGEPLPGLSCRPWSLESEVRDLQEFDIGLMPMPEDEWTRGKCAFKAIEYMSVGIPAVCSPVGMNLSLIEDGVDGFLPQDPMQWETTLARLIEDPELRGRIGGRARAKVERFYSVERVFPLLLDTLLEAAGAVCREPGARAAQPFRGGRTDPSCPNRNDSTGADE